MVEHNNDAVIIDPALIEQDVALLLEVPVVLREVHRHTVSAKEFFDHLRQGLARGLMPDEWLSELAAAGQVALIRRLALHSSSISPQDLKRVSNDWEKISTHNLTHTQERLELHQGGLDSRLIGDLEKMLERVQQLVEDEWFDLAGEDLAEIDRLLDLHIADASQERQERFEKAQNLIIEVRRGLLYAEPVVRQQNTTEIVWELLGYADRLATSLDCDLEQVAAICQAIQQLYQGAPAKEDLLNKYRALYKQPGSVLSSLTTVPEPSKRLPTGVVPLDSAVPQLERVGLAPGVAMLLSDLIGMSSSLLHIDLMQVPPPPDSVTNEESARLFQERLMGLLGSTSETDRRTEVLQRSLVLLRYWSGRKSMSDEVRRQLTEILFAYANLRARGLLTAGRWDSAAEYYRLALRLRAQRRVLGARQVVYNYFAAYATYTLLPDQALRLLEGESSDPDKPLLRTGFLQSLANADETTLPWVGLGAVKLAAEDPWLLTTFQTALCTASDPDPLLGTAFRRAAHLLAATTDSDLPDKQLAQLVERYRHVQESRDTLFQQLLEATENLRTLSTLPHLLNDLHEFNYPWEPTDQKWVQDLEHLGEGLSRYFIGDQPFQERDRLAGDLQRQISALVRLALQAPTVVGTLVFSRLVNNILLLIEQDQRALRRGSQPRLVIQLVQSEWRSNDAYYCHLQITNEGDMRADQVRIQIEDSPVNEYRLLNVREREQNLETLWPRQPRTVHVRIIPTPLEEAQTALTLLVRVQYRIPDHPDVQTRAHRLRVDQFATERGVFQKILNPYMVGGIVQDPALFKGRQDIISDLLAIVAQPERSGAVVIYGQKRSGKSSLLYHLIRQAPHYIIPVEFDIPSVLATLPRIPAGLSQREREQAQEEMLGRLLFALVRRTMDICREHDLAITPMDETEIRARPGPDFQFRQFLEQFRQRPDGYRLLYVFDEFTTLIEKIDEAVIDETIMRLLKSLIEKGYFSSVISGLTEVYEAVKRYANQLAVSQPRQVDYLDLPAAHSLIEDPIRLPDKRSRFYSTEVVDEIIDLTAGSPFYIQMFCRRLVDYMNEMEVEGVTAADVSAVTTSLIEGNERIDPIQFDNLYSYKENAEVDNRDAVLEGLIVHLLAHETATKPYASAAALLKSIQAFVTEDDLDTTLNRLEQRRTVMQQADEPTATRMTQQPLRTRQYRIRIDLFRRWLLKNRPIDDEALRSFERKVK